MLKVGLQKLSKLIYPTLSYIQSMKNNINFLKLRLGDRMRTSNN